MQKSPGPLGCVVPAAMPMGQGVGVTRTLMLSSEGHATLCCSIMGVPATGHGCWGPAGCVGGIQQPGSAAKQAVAG